MCRPCEIQPFPRHGTMEALNQTMRISERIAKLPTSGTVRLGQAARELKASGKKIIELGEGEPDFDTPRHVIEAAYEAALRGETKYTSVAGTPQLREAAAAKLRVENSAAYEPEHIVVGNGAKQLIFNAMLATLNPGDEVVIPAPYWVSYPAMVALAEGKPVIVRCAPDSAFKLTPGALRSALSSRTRWIILNSPGNPAGCVYGPDELAALAEVVRGHPTAGVVCDDIYEKIVFADARFATMAAVAPDLRDRILTVNGVSKCHAMTGWRIGYAAGPTDLIGAMVKLQGQSTTNASSIGQAAAIAALTGPQDHLDEWIGAYERRRALVSDRLSKISSLRVEQPEGAFYHFVGCGELYGAVAPDGKILTGDRDFCEYLLHSAGVAVVPGSEFGMPGYFRLCFAKSDDDLRLACDKIGETVSGLKLA